MIEKTVYRLESRDHFWNFPSFEEANIAAQEYQECVNFGMNLKKVLEVYDESGKLISTKEVQNEQQISDARRFSLH